MDVGDEELQKRMDKITETIKNGCGNPNCEIAFCKSNPDRIEIDENSSGEFVIATAVESYAECAKYLTPNAIMQMTPQNYAIFPISEYLNDASIKASFRDFPVNINQRPTDNFQYINYQSIFIFMNSMMNMANPLTLKKMFDSVPLINHPQRLIFLCVPYKLKYFDLYGRMFSVISNDHSFDADITQFLGGMDNSLLVQVHSLIHSYLHEMFNRGVNKKSSQYPFMLYPLRLFRILYNLNLERNYTTYDQFYVKSISVKRDWNDDFDDFFENKEGLLSFGFVIELHTRVLVVHEENRCEQQIAVRVAAQNNFFELLNPYLELKIDRNNLLLSSLNSLNNKRAQDFKKELKIQFVGEVGVDQGGVSKEWFNLIVKELFKVDYGMFTYNKKTRQFWFSGLSEDLADFQLVGIVLGLAIYNNIILDISFPSILFKKLLDIPLSFHDYEILDPECFSSIAQLQEMSKTDDVSVLELYFEATLRYFDDYKSYDLIPNGKGVLVTNENLQLYLYKYSEFYCTTSIQRQFDAFKNGFRRVVSSPLLLKMRPEELELVICGTKEYDFIALQKNTKYKDYSPTSPEIVNFWEITHSLTLEQKKKLLLFITSNDRVPVGGLGNLLFIIDKYGDPEKFPTASTCFNALHLPPYKTKEIMREKILFAIENATGFGLA